MRAKRRRTEQSVDVAVRTTIPAMNKRGVLVPTDIPELGPAVVEDSPGRFHMAAWWWGKGGIGDIDIFDFDKSLEARQNMMSYDDLCTYLTDRQYEVLVLWRMGKTQREIATILGCSRIMIRLVQDAIAEKAKKLFKKAPKYMPKQAIEVREDYSGQIEEALWDREEDHWKALPAICIPMEEVAMGDLSTIHAPWYGTERYVPPEDSRVFRDWMIQSTW